jgi:ubiquinone/menaquinone biosynthesis C-methylase UbiE
MNDEGFSYDRDYYLSECDGCLQFNNSRGKVLGKRLKKMLELAAPEPGMRLLDVGCGRGELVLHGALAGASAWGIDGAAEAIAICRETLNFWKAEYPEIDQYARFGQADGRHLAFGDGFFDTAMLADVVEHLAPDILKQTLQEIKRVLKRGGRIVIHTSPNKYYIPVTGRLFALVSRLLYGRGHLIPWRIRPRLPRGLQPDVHVNEQSRGSLERILKKTGFRVEKTWFELNPHYIDALFPDQRGFRFINALKGVLPLKHLFYADLYCIARA